MHQFTLSLPFKFENDKDEKKKKNPFHQINTIILARQAAESVYFIKL